ncbi:hypothetical protein AB1Y20_009220 [Prymnesium parvum]|uniref:Uncharacterized protein n=1 Tax=Prymnesium parvum TaxID=97485 RepID=A0AB34K1G9_PRYPA
MLQPQANASQPRRRGAPPQPDRGRPLRRSSHHSPSPAPQPLACPCVACELHGARAPRLYHGERTDGTGSSLLSMLNAAAYAASRGWNYGGILRNTGPHSSARELLGPVHAGKPVTGAQRMTGHGQPFDPAIEFFLGSPRLIHERIDTPANRTLVVRLERRFSVAAGGSAPLIREMTSKLKALPPPPPDAAVVLPGYFMDLSHFAEPGRAEGVYDAFFSPPFRAALRASAACGLSARPVWHFDASRPSVAMHVRRGDVTAARHPGRFTSDEFYYQMAAAIRIHLPQADIHVFSSTKDQFRRGERNHSLENAANRVMLHSSSSFDGYRQRGMQVHLDGDPLEASAHLMTANVVVLAKSAFSWAPAAFNPHCVICQPIGVNVLRHWIVANDMLNVSRALPSCMQSWRNQSS